MYQEALATRNFDYGAAVAVVMLVVLTPVMRLQRAAASAPTGWSNDRARAAVQPATAEHHRTPDVGWWASRPIHVALIVIALIWLLPTVGLLDHLVPSPGRDPDRAAGGRSSPASLELHDQQLQQVLIERRACSRPSSTASPSACRRRSCRCAVRWPPSPSPGSSFPGRDLLFLHRHRDAAHPRPDDVRPAVAAGRPDAHWRSSSPHLARAHRVRASVRDLPAAQLLRRPAVRPDRGGAHRRRRATSTSSAASSCRSPCPPSPPDHLPVPRRLERPADGAGLRAAPGPADDGPDQRPCSRRTPRSGTCSRGRRSCS